MSETLREVALRDLQGLRARHREVFAPDWRRRTALLAGIILALVLAAYGFWRLDFSLTRLGSGLGQIAQMVSLMFPPSPGNRLPLAITASDFGSFGKLFSEAIEAADKRPVEGVIASGGTRLHALRFALIPQIFPVIASQVLYYFESNTRSATIIGIVGAGGIGLHLAEQIRILEWNVVAFLVLMILVAVAIIDWVSSRLRFAIIGRAALVL